MIRFYLLQYQTKQTMCHATGMRANYWHSSESQMWLKPVSAGTGSQQ